MFGVGVGRMSMAIVMGMIMAMFMVVIMCVVHDLKRAFGVDALHMVVVAFLHGAYIGLEAQNSRAVFADRKSTRLNSSHPVSSRMPSSA